LKLGHHVKIFLVKMMRATGMEIPKHGIRPRKVIPASHINATHERLLIIIHRLRKVVKRVNERGKRREGRMVGKRMILL